MSVLIDRAGRPQTDQSWRKGRPPANKGKRYQPNPPATGEVLTAVESLGDGAQDRRLAALIAVLWRAGLGLSEALRLQLTDLDTMAGVVLVRSDRRAATREATMDAWGFERVAQWTTIRAELPPGPLFCIVRGPTVGQDWSHASARTEIKRLGDALGIKRLVPQQLRYAHAIELLGSGVPMDQVYRHLGLDSARNNRLPALAHLISGPTVTDALKPPGAEKVLRHAKGTPSGEAYSLVRRAVQAADNAYRESNSRVARRAWNQAIESLHRAEESIMHATAEDYGATA